MTNWKAAAVLVLIELVLLLFLVKSQVTECAIQVQVTNSSPHLCQRRTFRA